MIIYKSSGTGFNTPRRERGERLNYFRVHKDWACFTLRLVKLVSREIFGCPLPSLAEYGATALDDDIMSKCSEMRSIGLPPRLERSLEPISW